MSERMYVMPLYDDGDELTEFMAKGHVDRAEMLAIVNEDWSHLGGFDLEDVEHTWRRSVPDPTGDRRCVYHPAKPGSRGAFRATVIDAEAPFRRAPTTPRSEDGGGKENEG